MNTSGEHHVSLRKRGFKRLDPYPHPNAFKRIIDGLAYVVGIITPLTSLPQLYEIWVRKSAVGVSLTSWSMFTVASIFWVSYAILHKEKPLIITQTLWFVLELCIVIGILRYR